MTCQLFVDWADMCYLPVLWESRFVQTELGKIVNGTSRTSARFIRVRVLTLSKPGDVCNLIFFRSWWTPLECIMALTHTNARLSILCELFDIATETLTFGVA